MGFKSKNKISTEFSMSSMTDIVFLLLIFFMLISPSVVPQGVKVNLPKSESNQSLDLQKITVKISEDLEYSINGKEIDKDRIENELREVLVSTPEDERMVILHVDKSVPMEHFMSLAGIAANNNARLTIATEPEK